MNRVMLAALAGLLGLGLAPFARADQIYQAVGVNDLGAPSYGLRMDGFYDGNTNTTVTFGFTNVLFNQLTSNGTATLSGLITVNRGDPGLPNPNYNLNVNFTQVATPPGGNPNNQYYVIQQGGLRNVGNASGDHGSLTTFPPDQSQPFTVGLGVWDGNMNMLEAVGWVGWSHFFNGATINSNDLGTHGDLVMELIPVPEPSTMCLAFSGLMGFGWLFWRRSVS